VGAFFVVVAVAVAAVAAVVRVTRLLTKYRIDMFVLLI
jgi:hypothetical protein